MVLGFDIHVVARRLTKECGFLPGHRRPLPVQFKNIELGCEDED